MGNDKIAVISEKKYKFEGLYDLKQIYNYLKKFLEHSRHYEIAEKDYEEKNDNGSRKIMSKTEAEVEYNDYYKIIIKYDLTMQGNDMEVKINEKKTIILTKGKAQLTVNCYIEPDFDAIRPKTNFGNFLDNVYTKFFRGSELDKCKEYAINDVNDLIFKFKQELNSVLK